MHDLLQIRTPVLNFYVLRDRDRLYILDAGFIHGRALLRNALKERGWDHLPIEGIIVTHGHLDHILNVKILAEETGAWIAAPALDRPHYEGHPCYSGWARVTGILESWGYGIATRAPRPAPEIRRYPITMSPGFGFDLKCVKIPGVRRDSTPRKRGRSRLRMMQGVVSSGRDAGIDPAFAHTHQPRLKSGEP